MDGRFERCGQAGINMCLERVSANLWQSESIRRSIMNVCIPQDLDTRPILLEKRLSNEERMSSFCIRNTNANVFQGSARQSQRYLNCVFLYNLE